MIHSFKVWRYYLLGVKFKIQKDHESLRYLSTQPHLNRRQCRWIKLLQEFVFYIEYVKGKESWVADVLYRRPLANAISCVRNHFMDEIKRYYATYVFFNFHSKVCLRKLGPQMKLKKLNVLK